MNQEQEQRLRRYLINSRHFLWRLGPRVEKTRGGTEKHQAKLYKKLREEGKRLWGDGFDFRNGPYDSVLAQLLVMPGIERLLADCIVPSVEDKFSKVALDYLHICWKQGTKPKYSFFLSEFGLDNAEPFLEANDQFSYFERWGEFAPIWFEELVPMREQRRG